MNTENEQRFIVKLKTNGMKPLLSVSNILVQLLD